MKKILSIQDVVKVYPGNVSALKSVSFDVFEGEFVSIIGPSGSGKSSLLRCINRMIDVTSGSIHFLHWNVTEAQKRDILDIRKEIGMIFQHYNLVYRLNALENVLHGRLGYYSVFKSSLGLYQEADVIEALSLMSMLGIESQAYQRCAFLSGGQKQRVGIARALIQKPKMLLCDEPIASLDPQASKTIMDHLKQINVETGIPCLVNLHQVDVAKQYSERIIGIKEGSVVFDGPPSLLDDATIALIYGGSVELEMQHGVL